VEVPTFHDEKEERKGKMVCREFEKQSCLCLWWGERGGHYIIVIRRGGMGKVIPG